MIFTSFLTVVFVFMIIYTIVFIHHTVIRLVLLFSYCAAIFFIWNPDTTTIVANFFGVGRGLDFVLVLFSVAIVNGIFFIVRHLNSQHQNITKLTRHIAIYEAKKPVIFRIED